MTERPILFTGELVRAILRGDKTETRRVIKPQPPEGYEYLGGKPFSDVHFFGAQEPEFVDLPWDALTDAELDEIGEWADKEMVRYTCPYGAVRLGSNLDYEGDLLWVKERYCCYADPSGITHYDEFLYAADNEDVRAVDGDGFQRYRKDGTPASPWKSPLFMPRWASRLTLRVTDVRVERLQAMTHADAIAEGIPDDASALYTFSTLWDEINAKRGCPWASNCWVWVVSFEVQR